MKLKSFSELHTLLPGMVKHQQPEPPIELGHDGKGKKVHILLDTKGRKGKTVTVISGLQHNPEMLSAIARKLKQYCGAGGTVNDGNIQIQGDQRERAAKLLRAMNYIVL